MFVKLMIPNSSGQPLAEFYETPSCRFETRPWDGATEHGVAHYACMIVDGKEHEALVPGSAYILNNQGDTIDRWEPNFKVNN